MWCVLECVSVRMLVVRVCACVRVCSSGTKTKTTTTHTHTRTALKTWRKKKNENHFSEMSRFYELKHCDGRDDFYH